MAKKKIRCIECRNLRRLKEPYQSKKGFMVWECPIVSFDCDDETARENWECPYFKSKVVK